jgi:hypothetical protein
MESRYMKDKFKSSLYIYNQPIIDDSSLVDFFQVYSRVEC